MTHPLTIYSAHRDIRELLLSAAGDDFTATVRTMPPETTPDHPGQEIIILDLRDLADTDAVQDTLERFAGRAPSCRILFLIRDHALLPETGVLRQCHAEPVFPPLEARAIHLTLSRVALEMNGSAGMACQIPQSQDLLSMTHSQSMRDVFRKVQMVAPTRTTVLLTGETGTGKSYLAKLIHQLRSRCSRQFISVHCGALPESLIESELFGHEKGAFTGAARTRKGKFELADGGTIFLDEIGTITPSAQIKLLHILQEKAFERVGGEKLIPCDVRIIAATNEDPAVLCEQGKFRWDLFYRLNVFPVEVPPLRQRVEDILPLAEQFIANFRRDAGKNITGIAPRAARALQEYAWPGNVRELENIIERACILEETDQIHSESLPLELLALRPETQPDSPTRSDNLMPLHAARAAAIEEFERRYLWALLQSCNGSIKKSADTAGITTRQLHKLMTRHRLDKKSFRPKSKRNS
jgi:transcriptional regulator with GAF, ATPase, and Fis domain